MLIPGQLPQVLHQRPRLGPFGSDLGPIWSGFGRGLSARCDSVSTRPPCGPRTGRAEKRKCDTFQSIARAAVQRELRHANREPNTETLRLFRSLNLRDQEPLRIARDVTCCCVELQQLGAVSSILMLLTLT
eukprot:1321819-Rhodomonas_salina.1